jgi:2,3,4,5-tetrahydropyridine-2-carboxylate N-succinyltransferase
VWFPTPVLGEPTNELKSSISVDRVDSVRGVQLRSTRVVIEDVDEPPTSVGDAYLRLHLLSHRLVRPNDINLGGIFGVLPTLCWTSIGPVALEDLAAVQLQARVDGRVVDVRSVDKFPRMLDYVVPTGVRIADANRVRLGAYLSPGTTVMHEGFVNFNAGTLGAVMIEGRLSQGVVVDDGSDIGGGASTMGTLSGGGTERVVIGKRCLLGANAGLGIALGDDCTVEAGLYLTAGTVVTVPDGATCKARELSGHSGLLFRRNSRSGAVEALSTTGRWTGLNTQLHSQ